MERSKILLLQHYGNSLKRIAVRFGIPYSRASDLLGVEHRYLNMQYEHIESNNVDKCSKRMLNVRK